MAASPTHRHDPHAHWAQRYTFIYETLHGSALNAMTRATLAHVQTLTPPGTSILDVGAGTGRLAIPLANLGYQVTAVDHSTAMLRQLQKTAPPSITCLNHLSQHHPSRPYQVALLVFTTISYLPTPRALVALLRQIGDQLAPNGYLIIDQPGPHTFTSHDHARRTGDGYVSRKIIMKPTGKACFLYSECTGGHQRGEPFHYQTRLRMRYWSLHHLTTYLAQAGFVVRTTDLSGHEASGARYLLCQRT